MDQWRVHCACVLNVEQVPLACLVDRRLGLQGLEGEVAVVAVAVAVALAVALAVVAEDCNCVGL